MEKEALWYTYTMEYYSAIKRNTFESVLVRQMNIEPITQSEVSQKKQVSSIKAYTWNLERRYWWTCLQGSNGDADIENRLTDTVAEGEGGAYGENVTETYTLPYVKWDSQWKFAVWCRKLKPSALWQPRRVECGGRWEGGSTGKGHMHVYLWPIHIDTW